MEGDEQSLLSPSVKLFLEQTRQVLAAHGLRKQFSHAKAQRRQALPRF